ncbi:MAG TPA: hypothetical protein VFR10_13200, partial [bacterium]|nr:hypothetical protein [bacterium]
MIEATIETAVLFDLSNSSRLVMSGKDRKDLLHRLSSNDIQSLKPGRGIATLLLERNGRLIDRLLVVDRGHDLLLLGNPGRGDIVREWIEKYTIMEDSQVRDVSGESSAHLLVGPRSAEVLDSAFEGQASPLQRYDNVVVEPGTAQEITIVRVEDYEGPAFLLIGPRNAAAMQDRIGPVAHATMEMLAQLRVKAGLPTWGSELDEKTLPLEARLVDAISFTKGCYVGQEIVARVHHRDRLKRLLCRLEVEGEN